MEKKNPLELVLNDAVLNVQNVAVSDYTKALLICRAKLSDVFNSVVNIYTSRYSHDEPKEFIDKMNEADEAIIKLISDAISVSLIESDYKEL
jgi:hypothetical protein